MLQKESLRATSWKVTLWVLQAKTLVVGQLITGEWLLWLKERNIKKRTSNSPVQVYKHRKRLTKVRGWLRFKRENSSGRRAGKLGLSWFQREAEPKSNLEVKKIVWTKCPFSLSYRTTYGNEPVTYPGARHWKSWKILKYLYCFLVSTFVPSDICLPTNVAYLSLLATHT